MQRYTAKNLFFNINYADIRLETSVNIVMHILNDIIVTTNEKVPFIITIYVDDTIEDKTYGMASWETRHIWLNPDNFGKTTKLNNFRFELNVSVILHELLHTVGLIGGSRLYQYVHDKNADPSNVYTGPNGLEQYIKVLQSNHKDVTNIRYLPLENHFGDGTETSHLEEGLNEDKTREQRIINGTLYPAIKNEIMTGFLENNNFITPITLGLLQDLGFIVNYSSQYVTTVSENLIIV
jgi:hypothetical protein